MLSITRSTMRLDPFTCVQLLDGALQRGFTVFDSFLMLNSDKDTLQNAYDVMESMGKYSLQQLEYISTILMVQNVHFGLINSGELLALFSPKDTKRYSIIVMDSESDDPVLGGASLHFSEHGLRGYEGKENTTTPDLKSIIKACKTGHHLIRYMNKPYADKYQNDMWVPVLLKDKEIINPK